MLHGAAVYGSHGILPERSRVAVVALRCNTRGYRVAARPSDAERVSESRRGLTGGGVL